MNEASHRELELFTEAVALSAAGRAALLERVGLSDAGLRERVEALLKAHDRVGDFLEHPPEETVQARPTSAVSEQPGDRIGRYKLLQQIGEGGCGVVYMAEQEEPVRRRVALKIIKPGMDTRSVIARFEAERQALAMMDHPNIAKVFDAGATDSGRPFFVMELVRGQRITDYCDEHALTTEARLELFIQVCQAVQHAHQKGIIHRDLKPSNILVTTSFEGAPLPVVIDFGIVKAVPNLQLTDKTFFTAFEMLIGTPAYMSPEQAAFTSVDVDTRTDIYSLGVLLYELLTGSTPFNTSDLMKAGLDEIRRVIREVEPARPSTRLLRLSGQDLTTVALRRRAEPPKLIRAIAGDLDWIAMKALEKDRTRRYETANGLARDIRRFLANETISARPPSGLYRFAKLVRRNRLLFGGLGLFSLLLVASLVIVSATLAKERQARHEADVALQQARADQAKAETEATRSRQVTRFLEAMLEGVGPSVALGEDTRMLRGILDRTAAGLDRSLAGQPEVEAQLRGLIGRLYLDLGQYDAAEDMHTAELALCESQFNANGPEVATALAHLGNARWKKRDLAGAETAFRRALGIRRNLHGNEHPSVAAILNSLGAVCRRQRRLEESESLTREGLAIRQRLFGRDNLEVADSLRNLAILLVDQGRRDEAEEAGRAMLAMRRRLLGPEHPQVATALTDLAWIIGVDGNAKEVEALETEAFLIQRKTLGDAHPDVAKSAYLLAERMRRQGALTESHAVLRAVLSIQRKLLGAAHPDTLATLRALGMVLEATGDWENAEAVHREALAEWRGHSPANHPQVREQYVSLIRILIRRLEFDQAASLLDEILTPDFVDTPQATDLLALRAELRIRLARFGEALADAARAVRHRPDHPGSHQLLASLQALTGDRAGYAATCRTFFDRFAQTTDVYVADQVVKTCLLLPNPAIDPAALDRMSDLALSGGEADRHSLPYFQLGKALSLHRLGRTEAAIRLASEVRQGPHEYTHAQACAILAMAHWQRGETDTARSMFDLGTRLAPSRMPDRVRNDPDRGWLAWIFARVSLNEAASILPP